MSAAATKTGFGDRPRALAPKPPLAAIALVSAAAIGYEILLLRLFSIIQWHHFAYMIISLALLGYGSSGTFLAIAGRWPQRSYTALFAANAVFFGFSSVGCFLLAQRVPFNPLELLWEPRQFLLLAAIYVLLSIPFFFAANCIGLSFYRFRDRVGRIYGSDLLGAGVGAAGVIVLLLALSPSEALRALGALGPVAAALSVFGSGVNRRWLAVALLAATAAVPLLLPGPWTDLRMSPYKGLSQALRVSGAKVVEQRFSPFGLLSVVESRKIPFRHAPGLSLLSPAGPPDQLAVFTDGGALTVINRYRENEAPPAYLDFLTAALPYRLLRRPKVLVVGAGGGTDVLQALYHRAESIDAVELNPRMADLMRRDYAAFAGRIFDRQNVRLHVIEARAFAAASEDRFDLIQMALVDAFGPSSAGLLALNESYLYTVEALERFLARLAPGGLLAITRWTKLPPRDGPKLLATAIAALRKSGVARPERRLALIRSWKTSTLLVKNGEFSGDDVAVIRRFCRRRAFDIAYMPGLLAEETNRYNRLGRDYFFEAASALLGAGGEDFADRYKYDIAPATDDRPYFFNFFKWRLLPEVFGLRGMGGLGLMEWGYPVLAATLVQAAAAGLLLILLPLWIGGRGGTAPSGIRRHRVLIYFLALGLAFLFVEIAFIQKFILFLSHPLYAAAVVLSAFLVFAGLGSLFSTRLRQRGIAGTRPGNPCLLAAAAIAAIAAGLLAVLPSLLPLLAPLPEPVKAAVTFLLIAPLAFFMGMPFPLGLARLGEQDAELIPWAWAINGCASVLAAVLATLLAVEFGFTAVVVLAVGFYGAAAWAYF